MNKNLMQDEIENAVKVLQSGGIILYPTDTIWGIGCDATNETAVEKIYHIKKREKNKSMIVLLDSYEQLKNYINDIPLIAYDLQSKSDRPVTFIYPSAKNLAKNILATDGSIAIRIPKKEFCNQLIKTFGKPIVSTSVNLSGEPSAMSFGKISFEILSQMDYIVQLYQDQILDTKSSRIIKLIEDGTFVIIRE